ncbi:prim-pol domain-containing protein [Dichomitus squalens LYAD-421 SS1]|uniref:DNA primase n=1 Tax=Dichomitus squalens (strain LYAD-421) TaxID=732165 RepID=R7SWF4_DICSQ|nr:prim-pol domain-containing protein [Dichomitus squalens LYAD-421 SS1]EJF59302.1 prim-pol domain-containing protein [Dichomitus squalens LYAD-421 SS1]
MLAFYRRLYPFKSLFTWLNHEHAPTKLFTHREFAFTLQGDVYLRYNSFATSDDLKKQVCAYNPTRFEIGPVYSARPRDKKTVRPAAFSPQLRELVFDIDMSDYDPVRTCCAAADICRRCWQFIAAAVRVLDRALRDQFGYTHLLWVYSGRRGIHLWISDRQALELTDEQRRALIGWLTVIQGGKEMHKKVNVRVGGKALPPSLGQAYKMLEPVFHELILDDQDLFASEERWEALLHLVPDAVREKLKNAWERDPHRASADKWQNVLDELDAWKPPARHAASQTQTPAAIKEDIVLQYTYPRLDAEVSKHRNHLLKAPFCVHPKTGRVCVPVDPRTIDRFDPGRVPTVHQLLRELDAAAPPAPSGGGETGEGVGGDKVTAAGEHHADWERTSLKPYVELLDRHARGLMEETRRAKQKMDLSW